MAKLSSAAEEKRRVDLVLARHDYEWNTWLFTYRSYGGFDLPTVVIWRELTMCWVHLKWYWEAR